jgi:hypothetical protein
MPQVVQLEDVDSHPESSYNETKRPRDQQISTVKENCIEK